MSATAAWIEGRIKSGQKRSIGKTADHDWHRVWQSETDVYILFGVITWTMQRGHHRCSQLISYTTEKINGWTRGGPYSRFEEKTAEDGCCWAWQHVTRMSSGRHTETINFGLEILWYSLYDLNFHSPGSKRNSTDRQNSVSLEVVSSVVLAP